MGKEADVNYRSASIASTSRRRRDVATLSINAYANDPREMCET